MTLPKATGAGTYTVKVRVTAAGNRNYEPGSKTVTYKIAVTKAANPITVTPAARTASFETLRTRAVTVTKPLAVSGSIGTKTYARARKARPRAPTPSRSGSPPPAARTTRRAPRSSPARSP